MTVRELREILFQIEEQEAEVEMWYDGDVIDVAEIIPQPVESGANTVILLINA
jgi:hypothetical protein